MMLSYSITIMQKAITANSNEFSVISLAISWSLFKLQQQRETPRPSLFGVTEEKTKRVGTCRRLPKVQWHYYISKCGVNTYDNAISTATVISNFSSAYCPFPKISWDNTVLLCQYRFRLLSFSCIHTYTRQTHKVKTSVFYPPELDHSSGR